MITKSCSVLFKYTFHFITRVKEQRRKGTYGHQKRDFMEYTRPSLSFAIEFEIVY